MQPAAMIKETDVTDRWAQTEVNYVSRNLSTESIGGGNDQ
jgi:hypothetical protein